MGRVAGQIEKDVDPIGGICSARAASLCSRTPRHSPAAAWKRAVNSSAFR